MSASGTPTAKRARVVVPDCPVCLAPLQGPPAHAGRRIPKSLGCGHFVCLSCASRLWEEESLACPLCKQATKVTTSVNELPTCFPLLEILGQQDQPEIDELPIPGNCSLHTDKAIEAYCRKCNDPVCLRCILSPAHAGHPIVEISEAASDASVWMSQLNDQLTKLQAAIKSVSSRDEDLTKLEVKLEEQIETDVIAPLRLAVEAHKEALISTARQACKQRHVLLENQLNDLEQARKQVSVARETCTTAISAGNTVQVVQTVAQQRTLVKPLVLEPCCRADLMLTGKITDDKVKQVLSKFGRIYDGSTMSISRDYSVFAQPQILATHGTGPAQVKDPAGLCESANGGVMVCDFDNGRIMEFFLDGRPSEVILAFTDGTKPMGITRVGESDYIVTDHGRSRVFRVDSQGKTVWSTSTTGTFNKPWDVKVLPDGRVVVSDCNNHRLQILEGDTGLVVDTIKPVAPARLKNPAGLAIDSKGRIYIVDHGNDRVVVLESDGSFVKTMGADGAGLGQLSLPQGVALDGFGNILVADRRNQRIMVFRPDGGSVFFSTPAMSMRVLVHSTGDIVVGGCDAGSSGGACNSFLCAY